MHKGRFLSFFVLAIKACWPDALIKRSGATERPSSLFCVCGWMMIPARSSHRDAPLVFHTAAWCETTEGEPSSCTSYTQLPQGSWQDCSSTFSLSEGFFFFIRDFPRRYSQLNKFAYFTSREEITTAIMLPRKHPLQTFSSVPEASHKFKLFQAYVELIERFGWRSYTILYEDNQGLVRLQELLKSPTQSDVRIVVRQLPADEDYR